MTRLSALVGSHRANELSSLKLPTLPPGTPFLLKSLTDENIDFVELAATLEKFPSIAGKLISLANSVWSAPASDITSLEATCSRLGFGVVRSTSIALAIAAPFDAARCPSFDPERFWLSALLVAEAASGLALAADGDGRPEPSTARAAGLLHNLGLLWLTDRLPEAVDEALALSDEQPAGSLRQALVRVLGFDQAEAGGHLAAAWELPAPLALAMAHYPDADYRGPQRELVHTVGLAVELVSSLLADMPAPAPAPAPEERLASLGIAAADFGALGERVGAKLEKIRDIASVLV